MASENDTGASSHEARDAAAVGTEKPATTELPAPARVDTPTSEPDEAEPRAPEPLAPERYKVQFTASEEYVQLVEEAKALLSYAAPRATLDEIHLRALRAFVAQLQKQKYATSDSPARWIPSPAPCERPPSQQDAVPPALESDPAHAGTHACHARYPRQRGRHIPAAVRRAVFARDGAQCTYVNAEGRRCPETHRLEFHHLEPFARGGEHTPENVTLRCAAHNGLAAEDDFGREVIDAALELILFPRRRRRHHRMRRPLGGHAAW
jgi:5-methylcytosine-specific restriction endonuclease McrA